MKKQSGFTIIELLIVVAIVGIFIGIISGGSRGKTYYSDGTYCHAGYKWVTDSNGTAIQIMSKDGPVQCEQPSQN